MTNTRSPIVLMYHGTPANQPESHYSIRANLFAKHLDYLKRKGWETVLYRDLHSGHALPEKAVVLTLDDGYADNYDGAFLPLVKRGMKATWFITTDCIGGNAHWLESQSDQSQILTTSQLAEMHAAGMEIASHTCSHPDLSRLSLEEQLPELSRSKKMLEDLLSSPVLSLAYPFGRFNADSLVAAEQCGYRSACTTRPGWLGSEKNPFMVRRIAIFSGDSISTLARKLAFADNDVSWKKIASYYASRARDALSSHL